MITEHAKYIKSRMDVYKTSYGNFSGFLIKNDRTKHNIIRKICHDVGFNILDRPTQSYKESYNRILSKKNIVGSYISSGKPCYLYLTSINNEYISLIIEKDIQGQNKFPKIVAVSMNFDERFYKNTLIYGELYRFKEHNWYFIMDDIDQFCGHINKGRVSLFKAQSDKVMKGFTLNKISPFNMMAKSYVALPHLKSVMEKTNINIIGTTFRGHTVPIVLYDRARHIRGTRLPPLPFDNLKIISAETSRLIGEYGNIKKAQLYRTRTGIVFNAKIQKTPDYGIYHLYTKDNYNIGIARITTIESSIELIALNFHNTVYASIVFEPVFNKYALCRLIKKPHTLCTKADIIRDSCSNKINI